MERPFAALTKAAGISVDDPAQDPVLPPLAALVTPVTPVSASSFAALQDTIIRGDAWTLDEVNKQKLKRHIGKLAKAAQVFLARNALQEDHIRSSLKINDEAKPRRSTRPIVFSTAKVISYEDLTSAYAKRAEQEEKASARKKKLAEARAKRAEQEEKGKVKSRKRICSQTRKGLSPRACNPSAESEARRACDESDITINASQAAKADCVGGPIAQCPGRAPTARMW